MQPKTWVEISKRALQHNARTIRAVLTPGTALMAVIKSNAYGHGAHHVIASVDALVDWYGVDSLLEAKSVRANGTLKPILILGYTPRENIRELVRAGFSQTVYTKEMLRALGSVATKKYPSRVHLKIETGTSRQGILLRDLPQLVHLAKKSAIIVEGVSTHYSSSEEEGSVWTLHQLREFTEAQKMLARFHLTPPFLHSACSAALFRYPQTHGTLVRAGISLYGLWPSSASKKHAPDGTRLLPALAWRTRIAQIKFVPRGATVSYGRTEKLTRDSRVAVLPIGYWDGLDRGLSSSGIFLVHGKRVKVLGRICMNMCMIDITRVPQARFEDTVTILGRQGKERITSEDLAQKSGTIHYEVITRINPLIPRIFTS